jgi:hypothetical protein
VGPRSGRGRHVGCPKLLDETTSSSLRPAAVGEPPDSAPLHANDVGVARVERERKLDVARTARLLLLDADALHAFHPPGRSLLGSASPGTYLSMVDRGG